MGVITVRDFSSSFVKEQETFHLKDCIQCFLLCRMYVINKFKAMSVRCKVLYPYGGEKKQPG